MVEEPTQILKVGVMTLLSAGLLSVNTVLFAQAINASNAVSSKLQNAFDDSSMFELERNGLNKPYSSAVLNKIIELNYANIDSITIYDNTELEYVDNLVGESINKTKYVKTGDIIVRDLLLDKTMVRVGLRSVTPVLVLNDLNSQDASEYLNSLYVNADKDYYVDVKRLQSDRISLTLYRDIPSTEDLSRIDVPSYITTPLADDIRNAKEGEFTSGIDELPQVTPGGIVPDDSGSIDKGMWIGSVWVEPYLDASTYEENEIPEGVISIENSNGSLMKITSGSKNKLYYLSEGPMVGEFNDNRVFNTGAILMSGKGYMIKLDQVTARYTKGLIGSDNTKKIILPEGWLYVKEGSSEEVIELKRLPLAVYEPDDKSTSLSWTDSTSELTIPIGKVTINDRVIHINSSTVCKWLLNNPNESSEEE